MATNLTILKNSDNISFCNYFLLFRGFKAARKHQNKILILVKMMYTSGGMTMPCFEKGEQAITEI